MRKFSYLLGGAVLAVAGWWLVDAATTVSDGASGRAANVQEGQDGGSHAAPPEAPLQLVVVESRARVVTERIRLRGVTEPFRALTLRSEMAGRVVSVPVRAGRAVKRGDVLCALDTDALEAQEKETLAQIERARNEAAASHALASRGFGASNEAIAGKTALDAAMARLDQVRVRMAHSAIAAPFDGMLESDTAETGSLLQPGSVCASIITLDPVKVTAFADRREVAALQANSRAEIRIGTDEVRIGTVTFVSRQADAATRTFRVEVTLANPQSRIRAGVSARMTLDGRRFEAHDVPFSALKLSETGAIGVMVMHGRVARFMPVTILDEAQGAVQVAGLPESVTLVVYGQEYVADGQEARAIPLSESGIR